MEIDVTLDGGAYETLSPVVCPEARFTPPALTPGPNVLIQSRVLATMLLHMGSFAAFGAPQSVFALGAASRSSGCRRRSLAGRMAAAISFVKAQTLFRRPGDPRKKVEMDKLLDRALELSR